MFLSGKYADKWVMDMDLVREILLFAEKYCDGRGAPIIEVSDLPKKYHSVSEFVLKEHVHYAENEGLLVAIGAFGPYAIERLTPKGYDFLENHRKESKSFWWIRLRQWGGIIVWLIGLIAAVLTIIAFLF